MKLKSLIRSQFVISGLVYASGLAAFFIGDLLISKLGTDIEIADWAALKSSLFIGASLCLLGLDQALVRNPSSAGRIARLLIVQAIFMAAALSPLFWYMDTFRNLPYDYFALLALTSVTLSAATYRSRFHMIESQSAANHWRFFFGLLVAACFYTGATRHYAIMVVASVFLGLSVSFLIYKVRKPATREHAPDTETSLGACYRIGLRFCVSALFLNLSLYVEQLILKADGRTTEAATYFRYTTLFLMPAVAATGFLGFYLGPFTRLHGDRVRQFVQQRFPLIILAAAVATTVGIVPGVLALPYITEGKLQLDFGLTLCMAAIAFFRILMVLPSAYLGVHADGRTLDRFLMCSAAGIVMLVVVYTSLTAMEFRSDIAVALASITNWATRVSVGLWLTLSLMKNSTSDTNLTRATVEAKSHA